VVATSGIAEGEGLAAGMTGPEMCWRLSEEEVTQPENIKRSSDSSVIC
jgi:hypothetical protein